MKEKRKKNNSGHDIYLKSAIVLPKQQAREKKTFKVAIK